MNTFLSPLPSTKLVSLKHWLAFAFTNVSYIHRVVENWISTTTLAKP